MIRSLHILEELSEISLSFDHWRKQVAGIASSSSLLARLTFYAQYKGYKRARPHLLRSGSV